VIEPSIKPVSRARIKLHLFRETDLKPPFDKDEFFRLKMQANPLKRWLKVSVAPSHLRVTGISSTATKAIGEDGYTKRFLKIVSIRMSQTYGDSSYEDGLQDAIDTDYELRSIKKTNFPIPNHLQIANNYGI